MAWSELSQSAHLVYRFERFGPAEATALMETLAGVHAASRFTLDFSEVREFEDVAMGPLAQVLTSRSQELIDLRGLSLHQQRMLRYLGVELESQARPTSDL